MHIKDQGDMILQKEADINLLETLEVEKNNIKTYRLTCEKNYFKVKESLLLLKRTLLMYKNILQGIENDRCDTTLFNITLIRYLMHQNIQSKQLSKFATDNLGFLQEHFNLIAEVSTLSKNINKSTIDVDGVYEWINSSKEKSIEKKLVALAYFCKFVKDEDISVLHEYTRRFNVYDHDLLQYIIIEYLKHKNKKKHKSWNDLKKNLKSDLAVHFKDYMQKNTNLFMQSPLENLIKLGISIIKCPACEKDRNKNCPTCNESVKKIGINVPFLSKSHSIIRCSLTGDFIDESNHGYCTPDNRIVGKRTIDQFNSTPSDIKTKWNKKKLKKQETERVFFL